jgi:hypothetical protein
MNLQTQGDGCLQNLSKTKEEEKMNDRVVSKSKWNLAVAAGALLGVGLAAVPGAFAGPGSKIATATSVKVVAHLQVPTGDATHMQVVKQGRKQYLYVKAADPSQAVVVDVTKAGDPRLVDAAKLAGTDLTAASAESASDAPEILRLLNTSNWWNSSNGHQFSSAARFVADDRHGLIYVVDGEGLWIVKTHNSVKGWDADIDPSTYGG